MVELVQYRLIQDGIPVASVEGPEPRATREIAHYAAVYSQDGPVRVEVKTPSGWKQAE